MLGKMNSKIVVYYISLQVLRFACFSGIAVGIYTNSNPEEVARIALDAKADIVVVEKESHLKKILLVQHKLPELRVIVLLSGDPPISDKKRLQRSHKKEILSWSR